MTSESSTPSRPPAVSFVDPEQSFFRAWALRSSEHENSDPSSTSSTPISPKTVPKTVLARAKKASYQAQYSEASQLTEGTREPELTLSAPWRRAHTLSPGGGPQLTLTKPSVGGLPIQLSSRRPSSILGSRAQKLLRIHTRGFSDSTKSTGDSTASPSKETKNDYKWKAGISGYWFQIRIGRKRRSDGQLRTKSEETNPAVPDATMTANTPQQGDSSTHNYSTPALPTLISQKEGFYGRMRRKIGLSQDAAESAYGELGVNNLTGEVLNRASSILRPLAERNGTPPSSSASDSMNGPGSNPSIAGSYHNQIARLFPFHHKPGNSSSSSSRDMKMADPPQATPEPHALYTGSDKEQYFRVEFSDPDAPTFLPSEARRIGTPPLRHSTLRGFFFDYKNPEGDVAVSTSPDAVEGCPTQGRRRRCKHNDYGDWYKVKMEALEAQDAQSQEFILDVPEHLFNSPLCPRHPKHPSGGKGVCVYHGRNKSVDQK